MDNDSFTGINPLILGGNKRSYVLKQTCNLQVQVCVSAYDLLLEPGIKGLNITDTFFWVEIP